MRSKTAPDSYAAPHYHVDALRGAARPRAASGGCEHASRVSGGPGGPCPRRVRRRPQRFSDARGHKNYSGQSPVTRASGKKAVVLARYATNRRLSAALHLQALAALGASPGTRAYYDALRGRNIGHHAALRQLANRLVGILHGCLKTGTLHDEDTAWQHHQTAPQTAAT